MSAKKLIYAEDLKDALKYGWVNDKFVLRTIDEAPAIEAEPVRHGRWVEIRTIIGRVYTGCSICHAPIPMDCQLDSIGEDDCHYCYDCGARMDGERDDE